jgi:propanediol dehydratase small subunit
MVIIGFENTVCIERTIREQSGLVTADGRAALVEQFERNVNITVVCNHGVLEDVIDVEEVERGSTTRVSLRLDCREKTLYYP